MACTPRLSTSLKSSVSTLNLAENLSERMGQLTALAHCAVDASAEYLNDDRSVNALYLLCDLLVDVQDLSKQLSTRLSSRERESLF